MSILGIVKKNQSENRSPKELAERAARRREELDTDPEANPIYKLSMLRSKIAALKIQEEKLTKELKVKALTKGNKDGNGNFIRRIGDWIFTAQKVAGKELVDEELLYEYCEVKGFKKPIKIIEVFDETRFHMLLDKIPEKDREQFIHIADPSYRGLVSNINAKK